MARAGTTELSAGAGRADAALSAEAIRAHLARLLASPDFDASPRNREFLSFVVEEVLAGRQVGLKAYVIAIEAFHRPASFDAGADPLVRIEAGKLRRALERYYLKSGAADPMRIEIPRGRYVPIFTRNPAARGAGDAVEVATPGAAERPQRRWRKVTWAAAGLVAALAAIAWLRLDHPAAEAQRTPAVAQARGPAIVVLPFQGLGEGEGGKLLASGLTAGLISSLMRYPELVVYVGDPSSPEAQARLRAAATYLVSGTVQRDARRIRVTPRMVDAASGEVLWSRTYDRDLTTEGIFDVEAELSAGIVGRLAQPYGIIAMAAGERLGQGRPATLLAYDCVQRAFLYRRSFDPAGYPPVRACLEEATRRDPGYADAWAMLAFAHLDAARFELVPAAAAPGELEAALEAALRAVALAPDSVRSLQALAAVRYFRGEHDEAERVQREALARLPHDPETLAQLGWRLVARGRAAEALPLIGEAVERSLHAPPWYYTILALAYHLADQPAEAYDAAGRGRDVCCGLGQATLAITAAAHGSGATARAALAEALAQSPLLGRDPRGFWRVWHVDESVIDRFVARLAQAGLSLPPQT